jgi:DNA-binding NtrC family response regulator
MVWRAAGYIVVSATSIREAIDHFKAGDFDLVLLGDSISKENKERLTFLIRASGSRTPVACIANAPGDFDSFADATLKNDSGVLLTGMGELMERATRLRADPAILCGTAR